MMPANEMPERLAIWIDVEGFKHLHANHLAQALSILGRLTEDIFRVARLVYPDSPDRLFVHHAGDGFIIVADIADEPLDRFIAIAIALMRSLLSFGGLGRSGISSGDFADIFMCYPESVRDAYDNDTRGLPVGDGTMSIMRVMGGALINAVSVSSDGQKGPVLRIDARFKDQIEKIEGLRITDETDKSVGIDWINSEHPLADEIVRRIRGRVYPTQLLSERLKQYIDRFNDTLPETWKETATNLLP